MNLNAAGSKGVSSCAVKFMRCSEGGFVVLLIALFYAGCFTNLGKTSMGYLLNRG